MEPPEPCDRRNLGVHLQLRLNSTSHNMRTLKSLTLDSNAGNGLPKPIQPVARRLAISISLKCVIKLFN